MQSVYVNVENDSRKEGGLIQEKYLKGCSEIRMLEAQIGVKEFLHGVSAYLKSLVRNATNIISGNATTNDLWAALSQSSGKDVKLFMVYSIHNSLQRPTTDIRRTHGY